MKTFIVSQFYPPDFAATGQLLKELALELSKKGLKINVFTGFPSYAYKKNRNYKFDINDSIKVNRCKTLKFLKNKFGGRLIQGLHFSLKSMIFLIFNARKNDFIIFTTEPAFLPLFAYFIHIFKKPNYLILLYDLYPDLITEFKILKKNNLLIKLWKYFLRRSYKYSSKIIVLSESMKSEFIKNFPEYENKIEIISSWTDQDKIFPIEKEKNWFIKKYNFSNQFIVLYSGNQGRCHDLETIIYAANLLKKDKHVKFVFIGEGVQKKYIENLAIKLKIKNCLFLPYQDYEDLPYSLNIADLALVSLNGTASNLVAPSKLYGHLAASSPIGVICPESSYLYKMVDSNTFGESFKNGDYEGLAKWIKKLSIDETFKNSYRSYSRDFLIKNFNKQDIINRYYLIIKNENRDL